MKDKGALISQLRAIEARDLSADLHMIAQLAVIILDYRNGIAEQRGVPQSAVSVDEVVDGMLKGVGFEGGLTRLNAAAAAVRLAPAAVAASSAATSKTRRQPRRGPRR